MNNLSIIRGGNLNQFIDKVFFKKSIVIGIVVFFINYPQIAVAASNWDCDCSFRKEILLDNLIGSALTNYQIRIDVSYETAMNSDFSNLKFTTSNDTPISHWVETYTASTSAVVWVKIPTISASAIDTIYMYYGSASCTAISANASDVFVFYEDFSNWAGWTDFASGGAVVLNTTAFSFPVGAKTTNNDPNGAWKLLGTSLNDFRLITREQRPSSTAGNSGGALNRYGVENSSFNGYTINRRGKNSGGTVAFGYERRNGGIGGGSVQVNLTQPQGTWFRTELRRCSSTDVNEAELFSDTRTSLGGPAPGSIAGHNYNTFDRVTIRGGHDYYIDFMAVAKYTCNEPTVSVGVEEDGIAADFSASATTIAVGNSIDFTDNSTNNPTSWTWTFTGGTPATSTAQNPTGITYNTAGTYDVSLTVTNALGCSHSETKPNYITVQDYCNANITTQDEYLTRVQINNDIDNSSGYSSGGYGDYTNLSTSLMQGKTNVPVSININTFYTGDDISIWVDWNKDGDFTDAGEDIVCQDLTSTAGSFTFNVPATASLGNTRMRIRLRYLGNVCTASSCGNTTYGEVEDYSLNIISAGPTLNVNPVSLNFGDNCPNTISSPQSFTITGTSLTTDDILVAALNGYSYSTTVGGTYTSSLTLTQPGGSYTQTIYVKFNPTAIADYNGNIIVGGGGATNINVAVSGSGAGFDIPLNAVTNTVDCPNSTNGTIDLTVPFPIQFNDPNYIDINTTLLSNRTAFALEGWIKVDLASVGSRISLFGQNDAIEFGFNSATELTCWTASGGSVTATNMYPTDNGWHHVAVVGNGTNMILYIDGAQVAIGGITTANYGADTNFSSKIGAGVWDASGGVFPGQMIKVGFWSTALNATEIDNLASTYYNYTGSETGLLAGYNFFEGTGTTLGSIPTGTDGTFSGSPIWINNYTYLWTKTGDVGFSETTQDLSGVGPGTYNVVVTNSTVACPGSDSWTINHLDTEDPTITCPANVTVNPDAGLCTYSGGIGTPVTSDNCNVASVTNDAPATFPMGQTTVTWTVTDDAGNTATCPQTVTVQPGQIIDITVVDLGNSCQSGETGSTTTIIWDINLLQGSNSWTYDYTINDGTSDVQTGTNVSASGNIQISYDVNNQTATDKTYTITLTNVKDNCGVSEINTGNNSDVVTLFGVPATGEIIPD